MLMLFPTLTRHPDVQSWLAEAAQADATAVDRVLSQLSSATPALQHAMLEAIQANTDARLWQHLLYTLACQRWSSSDEEPQARLVSSTYRLPIENAITMLFTNDEPRDTASAAVKVAALRAALTNPDFYLRGTAACLLAMRGIYDANLSAEITAALHHDWPAFRLRAVRALAAAHDPHGVHPLIETLAAHEDPGFHSEVTQALVEIGDAAVPALCDALTHPQAHVRWHAAHALGRIGSTHGATALAQCLGDDDQGVRWAAAEALTVLGAPAVPPILSWLSGHPLTRNSCEAAFHALHHMQPTAVHERLSFVLDALRGPGADYSTPAAAFHVLQTWPRDL